MTQREKRHAQLKAFEDFVRILNDVDEPDGDWQNRLNGAWAFLEDFSETMGPDFWKIANWEGRLDHLRAPPTDEERALCLAQIREADRQCAAAIRAADRRRNMRLVTTRTEQ
jgi:hypothetical protein